MAGASASLAATTPSRLNGLRLEPAALTLIPGRTAAVRAIATYSDGSSRDVTAEVAFRSRDAKVATVDAGGVVTAVDAGRTEIAATHVATGVGTRSNAKISVPDLDAISVVPERIGLRVGGKTPVKALGTYEDGTTGIDLTASVVWSSAKGSVAKVVQEPDGSFSAVGVGPGTTNVIAKEPLSGVKSRNSTGVVTVVGKLLRLAVSPARKTLRVDERSRFKAIGTFERNVEVDVTGDVEWSTADPAIAAFDLEGRIRALAVGSTTARAKDRATGVTSTASAADGVVNVVGDVIGLRVTPVDTVLAVGAKANLKATASFAGQTETANFTTKVEWISSDPSAVAVDRLGAATCLAPGAVTVSARDPITGVTSTATGGDGRVLCGLELLGVEVVPNAVTLGLGKTKKVKAFLKFEGGYQVDVTKRVEWNSSERRIATVDTAEPNIGRITAGGDGVATVTARDPATGRSSADAGGTSCTVTVQGQPVSIQIEPDPGKGVIRAVAGTTLKLKVLAKYVGGATQGIDAFVTWSSSAPNVVKVSNGDDGDRPGFAHFLVAGTSTITIQYPKVGEPLPPGARRLSDTIVIEVRATP